MVSSEYDHQNGILLSRLEGIVTLKEVVDYIVATKENISYPRSLKILTDATGANMVFSPQDLVVIEEENSKSIERYDSITDAIVLESPRETALAILYQRLAENEKYKFQVFSTREAAIKWLVEN